MSTNVAVDAIDRLGAIRQQIRELEAVEQNLKNTVSKMGEGSYEGSVFDAQVIETVRHTLDSAAARVKLIELGVSDQWLTAHTKRTDITTVRTKLRSDAISKVLAA